MTPTPATGYAPGMLPHSWYADTANPHTAHPPLDGAIRCDVCVIGGGYTGLSAALELAERGFDVVVLEAHRVGWGASGRNGGQIITGFNKSMTTIERWVGRQDAAALWAMCEEAKALIGERVARHRIACDLTSGLVLAAVRRRHMAELAEMEEELAERYGYGELKHLDAAGIGQHIASHAYRGGLYDGGSGHLHPLNYALGLADACAAAGVRIFERSRARRLDTGPRPRAETDTGHVDADHLVLAGNAHLGPVAPTLAAKVMPVATYMIATAPLGAARAEALLPTDVAVSDMNFVLNYYRRSRDHRLLFGGGVSYSGLDQPGLAAALRRKMLGVFPELADVEIDRCWGGHVAITRTRMPHFGRIGPATYFAHGYSGHGVALAGMAGRLIAEALAGQAGRFDVFARLPHHRFPGGPALRRPALVLAMIWYRLRDLL